MSGLMRGITRPLQRLSRRPQAFHDKASSLTGRAPKAYSTMSSQPEWLTSLLLAKPSEPPRLYAWTPANLGLKEAPKPSRAVKDSDASHRIYILGVGNMGRLYATYLSKATPPPPITLVVHRPSLLETWSSSPGIVFTHHGTTDVTTDLDIEYWTTEKPARGPIREVCDGATIPNIIISTKASDALPEVDRMRHYLSGNSTVALAQNGMNKLWPPHGPVYVAARFPSHAGTPNFVHCITTHGVVSEGAFKSRHASLADAKVGLVLSSPETQGAAEWFLHTVASAPLLDSGRVGRMDLWVLQLEKLVVNAIINPLTAVLRCKNGVLFEDADAVLSKVMDRLLEEASRVYIALVTHPSSDAIFSDSATDSHTTRAQLVSRFGVVPLRDMLWGVGYKVVENTSSMLQDVQAGKTTEVRDFNGWIVDTARFLDSDSSPTEAKRPLLDVRCHARLIELVEDGVVMTSEQLGKTLLG